MPLVYIVTKNLGYIRQLSQKGPIQYLPFTWADPEQS